MTDPVEFLKSRSPGAQVAVVAAGVAVLGLIFGLIYVFLLRPDYEVLFTDLRAADAATIVAQLDQKKTPYRLENSGTTILVPESLVDATRLEVMNAELPLKGMVGFELFNKSDMGLTEFAQKINYQRALQGELSRTIMTIDSIEAARVHLTIPEATIFRADRRPPKASVTLIARAGASIRGETIAGVQRLVAASVADLDIADVVILDEHGALVSRGSETTAVAPVLQEERAVAQVYEARIRETVAPLYPDLQVSVILPADQWSASGVDGGEARRNALAAWRDGARTFRLDIQAKSRTMLTPTDQQDLRALIGQAIGAGDVGNDRIVFSPVAPAAPAAPAALEPPPISADAPDADRVAPTPVRPNRSGMPWPLGLGLLTLLALAGGLFLARPRRTRLTTRELDLYAARLRASLEEEEAYGAPPL